jgi:hypothetical protein
MLPVMLPIFAVSGRLTDVIGPYARAHRNAVVIALKITARVSVDCKRLVLPARHAMM